MFARMLFAGGEPAFAAKRKPEAAAVCRKSAVVLNSSSCGWRVSQCFLIHPNNWLNQYRNCAGSQNFDMPENYFSDGLIRLDGGICLKSNKTNCYYRCKMQSCVVWCAWKAWGGMLTGIWAVIRIRRIGQSNFKTRLCGLEWRPSENLGRNPVSLMPCFQTAFYMDWNRKYPNSPYSRFKSRWTLYLKAF